jgi:hypothetical protein
MPSARRTRKADECRPAGGGRLVESYQMRGRARPPQERRTMSHLRANGPNQMWSWNITDLPTMVRGVRLLIVLDTWPMDSVPEATSRLHRSRSVLFLQPLICQPLGACTGLLAIPEEARKAIAKSLSFTDLYMLINSTKKDIIANITFQN